MLSRIPLDTRVSIVDNPEVLTREDPSRGVTYGLFAGLGMSEGEDIVNVKTRHGKAGVRLDDVHAVMIHLEGR